MRSRSPPDRFALSIAAADAATVAAVREGYDKAQADARQALILAPDLAQAHLALAFVSEDTLDFAQASEAYERALALAPGNAEVLRDSGQFAAYMGHFDVGVAAARRAVVLDPLARRSHAALGRALYADRRYEEAVAAFAEVISLEPDYKATYGERGLAYYGLGDLKSARASCETKPDHWLSQQCLAVIYDKLGRHADAEAVLSKLKAAWWRYLGVPVRHDLCAVGPAGAGARMARDGTTAAGSGPGVSEVRPAPGPLAPRAALPGDRAGVEVPGLIPRRRSPRFGRLAYSFIATC